MPQGHVATSVFLWKLNLGGMVFKISVSAESHGWRTVQGWTFSYRNIKDSDVIVVSMHRSRQGHFCVQ